MKKDFDEAMLRAAQLEETKQLVGGDIYKMLYKLPSLHISKTTEGKENGFYDVDSFISCLSLLTGIISSYGLNLSLLNAELYNLHGINPNASPEIFDSFSDYEKMIVFMCKSNMDIMSIAHTQNEKLSEIIHSHDFSSDLEINSIDYCFIVVMLNNLFFMYSSLINSILLKRYLNKELIEKISEGFNLMICSDFDWVRRMFRVVECYKEIEAKPTLH